ncbi:hypothetical protein C1645_525440 [Glomus cerebriforme]|uniref:HMG box domain-containing protein n=1 Tax=Glomus cerebriforme TaxID=658196 RepID=A0A397TAR7_9GLOM|nr:hypothetical protein C1645_525440 [Glomus cerebriforme]
MTQVSSELDELADQVSIEHENELNDFLYSFKNKIDNDEMPKAIEILQDQIDKKNENEKIKRPPNSNIIYTNQLNRFGFLDIIRKFCDKHKINKQKLIPLSKKVSKILWKELPEHYQKFFETLASEVKAEHKLLYPTYKYQPIRKKSNFTTFKPYEYKTKSSSVQSIPEPDGQMEDEEESDYFDDNLPKFDEGPRHSPL